MKKVLFICSAGMSTSLLVLKTKEAAKQRGIEVEIIAMAEAEAKKHYDVADAILLGPQVRFLLNTVESALEDREIPVELINPVSYGNLDGNAILDQIIDLL